jgi:DNA polymerase-1
MPPQSVGRLFLIDGSSQMYRAYHAIRALTGPDGHSTNAVYGFITMLRKLIADHQPDLMAAAFDLPGPTFRSELVHDYKANRAPMPPDLVEQVPWVHEACEALGVPVLTSQTYEADDVIGTLARQAVAEALEVVIVTSDKDFFQLVGGPIRVFDPRDAGSWYDADAVKEKMGVTPGQVIDVLSLMGDAVDNVKGVPGIGEKGARELISTFGSLDGLFERASEVPKKRYRTALLTHESAARQSQDLVRIRTDAPVPFQPETLRYRGPDANRCFTLFSSLGFRTLIAEYAPTANTVDKDYAIVQSVRDLDALLSTVRSNGYCGIRVFGDSSNAMQAGLVGITLSTKPGHARYIPIGHRALGDVSDIDAVTALVRLAPMLEDPSVRKIGHDLKPDCLILGRRGVEMGGLDLDTILLSYLLDSNRSTHKLEDLSLEQLGYRTIATEDLLGRGAKALSFADLPPGAILDYAGERSDGALQLAERMAPRLAIEGIDAVYAELERPLVPVLIAIERAGVGIDTDALAAISTRVGRELEAHQREIHDLAGVEFNINSPKQLSEVLFDRLQLPALKRTGKTRAASTSVQVLEELALVHELPRKVLEWRSLQKLKGSYIDALPLLINPETGRVHTSFNQAVAATGRLSSSDPNLQNIPIRTPLGREIRRAFVADPGAVLISADYSQIELRVLAHLSGDATLIDAFRRGIDIHQQTANRVFGENSGLDPHELRRRAKIVNYALLYGKTAFTLARDIGVSQQSAQEFIDAYFEGFPAVRTYIDAIVERARETGVVTTMFGRRRLVPELTNRNGQIRAAAERAAVNMPIQGTAADILKRAMIDVHGALPAGARMILTVHDELLFEVPEAGAEETAQFARERMERAAVLDVPLTVDVGIGQNWKDAKS